MSKKLLFIFIAFMTFLSVLTPQPVFADNATSTPAVERVCLEVPLPNLPGLSDDPCSSPAAYIQYWFYFGLYLAGIAALFTLVAGGLMYMLSSAVPGARAGTKYITNASLGLILLFGSYLLLRTLGGEQFITLKNPQLPALPSCFIDFKPTPLYSGKDATVSWKITTKDAQSMNSVCEFPYTYVVQSHSLESSVGFKPNAIGTASCVFEIKDGADGTGNTIKTCTATAPIEKFYCSLVFNHSGVIYDSITWEASEETIEGKLSCNKRMLTCPSPQSVSKLCEITGTKGNVVFDNYFMVHDICALKVLPQDKSCSVSF